MGIYKRGPYFHYDFIIDGERYRGTTEAKSRTRAQKFVDELRAKIRGGDVQTGKAPLLSAVAGEFLKEMAKRQIAGTADHDTVRHYRNGWRMLQATDIANMRIDRISTSLASTLQFPGGSMNARAAQQVLGRLLNWSAEKGLLKAAPRIHRSRAVGRKLRIESWMEQKLLEKMETDCADVFLIMLDCGMRPEEVMRMRWENIIWSRCEVFIPSGKTPESRRTVPMPDRMMQVLKRRRAVAGKDDVWVFPGRSEAGHRKTIAKQFEAARTAAGLDPRIVLYLARHEFATTFLEHGGSLATLKVILGHTSISTTDKYLHSNTDGAAEVVNRRNSSKGLAVVKSA